MTLRVLHLHAGNLYGGVETILVTLARYAGAAPDVEHRFALCFEGRLAAELRDAGARVDLVGAVRISRTWTVVRARRELSDHLAQSGLGAVACHSDWSLAIFGPVIRAAHVPSVFWLHGVASGPGWLERWARRTVPDLVLCNSRFTAGAASRRFPSVPAEVVYPLVSGPGAPSADRETLRAALGAPRDASVIVQVSRMEAWKGHTVLLDALAELKGRWDWACWIAGGAQCRRETAYQEALRRRAAALGIGERVRFLGERTDVPAILAAADIFCQPNIGPEAFGITFIEAMHRRLPVIGSRLGATPEIVDESCGVLVEPGSAGLLARALADLLDHRERRVALGAHGPARASALCDPQRQAGKLADLFRQVAKERKAA
jgi:glycosyltransferase involved in cell wall biosynthesis